MTYQIVGRYMNGKEVDAYQLQDLETGRQLKATREQVAFLVGRRKITNCDGQIYKDKVVLRGKGVSLNSLPVVNQEGNILNSGGIANIRKEDTPEEIMNKLILVGSIMEGSRNIGYKIANTGGATKDIGRGQVMELARTGKLANATVQNYNGKEILRGKGTNLRDLPVVRIDD